MCNPDLIDPLHFPPEFIMKDPALMSIPMRIYLLRWLFTEVGVVTFKAWKTRSADLRPPVALQERWWSVDPEVAAFEKAKEKALNARPVYHRGGRTVPEPPLAAPQASGSARSNRTSPTVLSQYGSARSQLVHSAEHWQEDDFIDPPQFKSIPDPDDFISSRAAAAVDSDWPGPCTVPANGEARAQWCFEMIQKLSAEDGIPRSTMRSSVTLLAELPVCGLFICRYT